MAQMIVRNLDEDLKLALKRRAIQHGRSMEEEVRQILRCAVNVESSPAIKLGSRIASRFSDIGLDQPLPELHGQSIDPVTFER
jgi:plasmid stability protein